MGYIYLIFCYVNGKNYVGQTIDTIAKRWSEHQSCARMLAKAVDEKRDLPLIQNSVLYRAMVKYGIDAFSIYEIENTETEKLNECEVYWIKEMDCLAPKGFNLTTGGGSGYQHAPSTIALMKTVKQSRVDNYRNPQLLGLPAKTAYRNDEKHGEHILINDHPLCKSKMFYSRDYASFDATKQAVIDFLANLEKAGAQYVRPKRGGAELPKGVGETKKGGYRVNIMRKGRMYDRRFESVKLTKEQNKANALEYFNQLIASLAGDA